MRARHPPGDDGVGPFEPHDVSGLLAPPRWLRDLGRSAWLAVGVMLFVVGVVWVLSLKSTIVTPVITAALVAAVTSPLVAWLGRHGLARGVAAAIVFLALLAIIVAAVVVVVGGITSQTDELRGELSTAKDTIAGWTTDLGVSGDTARHATEDASSALSSVV